MSRPFAAHEMLVRDWTNPPNTIGRDGIACSMNRTSSHSWMAIELVLSRIVNDIPPSDPGAGHLDPDRRQLDVVDEVDPVDLDVERMRLGRPRLAHDRGEHEVLPSREPLLGLDPLLVECLDRSATGRRLRREHPRDRTSVDGVVQL